MSIYDYNLFNNIFGISEDQIQNIQIDNNILITPQGKRYNLGEFFELTIPFLLNNIVKKTNKKTTYKSIENVDICNFMSHHPNSLFQAASQFNYLEMVYPSIPPSKGINQYPLDCTQGPAVAIATYPSTLFRNWFLTSDQNQMNGLGDVMKIINKDKKLIRIQNGYILNDSDLNDNILTILNITQQDLDLIVKNNLKIGIVYNGENVIEFREGSYGPYTLKEQKDLVTTVWCSAIPLGYLDKSHSDFLEPLAKSVLKATYQLTLLSAIYFNIKDVYLTQVGGGVFRNKMEWIRDAIQESLNLVKDFELNVSSVFYRDVHPLMKNISI